MFNAEKLLGQVIGGVLGKGGGKGKKNLLGGLKSGAGLMTAIGLAVGAYEILKDKQSTAMPGPVGPAGPVTPPPPPGWRKPGSTPAMPPVPPVPPQPAAADSAAGAAVAPPAAGELSNEDLARRMIQVMIAAACADGTMDEQEEQAILDKLREAGLSQEEKLFMLEELHHPRDIATLTSGSISPPAAKVMYMLAVTAIAVDTEVERAWLDELARSLGLSPAVQKFIEEQKEAA
jgi:uncharacterized membrane protein YebE (DUF533 family)